MKNKPLLWGLIFLFIVAVGTVAGLWGSSLMRERRHVSKPTTHPSGKPVATEKTPVTLYYPNRKYVESGDENLPKLLTVKTELPVKKDKLLEAVIQAMQSVPADPAMATVIRKDLKINGVRQEKGLAYVDFSGEHLYGGSLEETMLVQAIVKTLTGIEGIQKVQFLVDGEIRETLMGHISVAEPIGRGDL